MSYNRIPLNLQFFADGGEGAGADPAQGAGKPVNPPASTTQPTAPSPAPTLNAEDFLKALESRTQRAEKSVVRSFAEQYGMTEDELTSILDQAKAEKAKKLPDDVQRQIDEAQQKANEVLIAADVRSIGSEMGLLDVDTALLLMDKSRIKVEDTKVSGVKEALEALKTSKAFLFGQTQPAAWAGKQNTTQPMTRQDILAIKDTAQRQKAIAQNLDLFKRERMI